MIKTSHKKTYFCLSCHINKCESSIKFWSFFFQLRIARKKRWNIQEEKRIQQEIELQTHLNRLILEDRDRKISELRKTGEDVDIQVQFISDSFFLV